MVSHFRVYRHVDKYIFHTSHQSGVVKCTGHTCKNTISIIFPALFRNSSIIISIRLWVGYLTALPNYECKPRVLDDYFLVFVSSGKGQFGCKGKQYDIKKLDAFFLFPGVVHWYKTDPANLLELWWIGFNGPNAQILMHDLGINPARPLLEGIKSVEIQNNIKEIVEVLAEDSPGTVLKASGNIYKLFGQLLNLYAPNWKEEYKRRIKPVAFHDPV